MVPEPDQERGQGQVPDQLVQERRLEGREVQVRRRNTARGAVRVRDLKAPRQRCRLAEQLLVEIVADPADRLGDEQRGGDGVRERAHGDAEPVSRQARPRPRGQRRPRCRGRRSRPRTPVPDVRDVARRGDVEVNTAADDAGRHDPQRDVVDQVRVAAEGPPATPGDQDRQRDPDDVAEGVEVDLQRADMECVDRRAGDELRERGNARGHAPRLSGTGVSWDPVTATNRPLPLEWISS